MCDLYYLDHFRPEVRAEAEETNEKIDAAEAAMQESKSNADGALDRVIERVAKITLDTTFVKINQVSDPAARERLIRYAGELCRKAQIDLDRELDYTEALKEFLEDSIGDD